MAVTEIGERTPRKTSSVLDLLYRPEVRQVLFQVILIVALAALFWMIITNTAANLKRQNIASGFGFWNTTSGFDISQTLISYSNTSTYGRAFWVGLTNTVLVNRHFASIEELEDAQAARCVTLQSHRALVRSTTLFQWWPQRLRQRQGRRRP